MSIIVSIVIGCVGGLVLRFAVDEHNFNKKMRGRY